MMRRFAPIYAFAVLLVAAGPVVAAPPPARPAGVDWGPGHFTGQHALKSWLSRRGIRYSDWVRQHPRAYYLMTHAPPRPAAAPRTSATTTSSPEGASGEQTPVVSSGAKDGRPRTLVAAVGGAIVLLLVFAALPVAVAAPLRVVAVAAAASLAVGLAIGLLL